MPTFHRFDAEMAELVEERDVTNSIKENQWSFLMDLVYSMGAGEV